MVDVPYFISKATILVIDNDPSHLNLKSNLC